MTDQLVDLPEQVTSMIDVSQYPQTASFDVERSYAFNTLAATQNANPLYWDDAVAAELTGGVILPPTTLSLWMRPHYWEPGAEGEQVALQVHFDMKALFGLVRPKSGTIEIDGTKLAIVNPRRSIEQGLAYVPEDRKADGLFLNKTVAFNIIASSLRSHFAWLGFVVRRGAAEQAAGDVSRRLRIKADGPLAKVGSLSGGNQQKALVGRWLIGSHNALLLEEPTRGVDIGAKVEIYGEINALAQSGLPVILYSSELLELIGMCDRVVVIRSGKVSAILAGADITEETILEKALTN